MIWGLYYISYPHTWYTLRDVADDLYFYCNDGTGNNGEGFFLVAFVDYGHYENVQELLKNMNASLKKYIGNDSINLTYSTRTGKVTVHLGANCKIGLFKKLSLILGYGGKEVKIDKTGESPHVVDLNIFSTIYTYCNIVQPQIVGDTSAQLLRSIPVEGKYSDIITKTFTNIQYVPVQTKSFGDVKIILRNDTGDPVPFERGKVIGTLHFRQHTYFT